MNARLFVSSAFLASSIFVVGCSCDEENPGGDGSVDAARLDGALRDGGGFRDGGPTCGNGVIGTGEMCDDANDDDDDGCSALCVVEEDFVCPVAGRMCVRVVTCGNARIEGDETCDDRNATAGDGCDADCHLEEGWICPVVGAGCRAAECGDGFLAGFEGCDDGDIDNDDGCDENCQLEEGAVCPVPGEECGESDCGDLVTEGTEECDDGNSDIGDGCTPFCKREPDCTGGICVAVCGDEVVFAPETCDDGNTLDGDGCSSTCAEEAGFTCTEVPLPPPESVTLPVVVRDFLPACTDGQAITAFAVRGTPGATPPYGHPDFQCFNTGLEPGMVETTLTSGRPVLATTTPDTDQTVASIASFGEWYVSDPEINRVVVQGLTLGDVGGGAYQFDSNNFYPLSHPVDGTTARGFVADAIETAYPDANGIGPANFFFTSEVRYWFEYNGTEVLDFSGDDDVFVFINERLAVDLGGVHGREDGTIDLAECANADPGMNDPTCLAPLGLNVGGIYEAVVFQAERHTERSQYRLTLRNFNRAPSVCEDECGDGIVTRFEGCDDGEDNGVEYNGCSASCELTAYCGDNMIQTEYGEVCDDGLNLGGTASACAPGCTTLGASCGDGVVQTDAGETCDDGNTTNLDGCDENCQFELL